jgi:hypothetical protein
MTNLLSSGPRHHASQAVSKAWKAPVVHVVRAADAQISLLNSTVDGGAAIGGIGVTTFGS